MLQTPPLTKLCGHCREMKLLSFFSRDHTAKDGLRRTCKPCEQEIRTEYRKKNPLSRRAQQHKDYRRRRPHVLLAANKRYRIRLKTTLTDGYGGGCTCCGETELAFLTLEHLNGDGKRHREEMKLSTYSMYRDVIRRGFPPEYTVLCINCNYAKRTGPCPHTLQEQGVPSNQPEETERLRVALRKIGSYCHENLITLPRTKGALVPRIIAAKIQCLIDAALSDQNG